MGSRKNQNSSHSRKKGQKAQSGKPVEATRPEGLTSAEVDRRTAAGQDNRAAKSSTRSIHEIIAVNVLTLFNLLNFALALLVIIVGWRNPEIYRNILFMGVVMSNLLIGIIQEIRAKLTVDRLSLLTVSTVAVMRDGQQGRIPVHELVVGDLVFLGAGGQIPVDGHFLHGESFEVDESLLTGESEAIAKSPGDPVLSGSFVLAGSGWVQVDKVGSATYGAALALEAKKEKKSHSVLMSSLNRIIKVLSFIIIPVGLLLFFSKYRPGSDLSAIVLSTVAAMIGMIPEGLMLLTSMALAVGVVNLGKIRTLVQSLPCIEALARVDILCLDKTGTITDGQLEVLNWSIVPDTAENRQSAEKERILTAALAALVNALPQDNSTSQALRRYFGAGPDWDRSQAVPFSSARKWSGASFASHGSWVIGAPEFVLKQGYDALRPRVEELAAQGRRILLLASSSSPFGADGSLPVGLQAEALIILGDHIRDDANETCQYFHQQGVALKIISGDNPLTASSAARRAGIAGWDAAIDMSTLPPETDLNEISEKYTVFGRVSPYQKRELLRALKKQGHTVAMTGDGVNDVLAMKEADCSVAMASGSDAARSLADLVLLDNSLSAMIQAVYEGRRVINNIGQVAALFLVKTTYSALLAVLFILLPFPYPFYPIQLTMIGIVTIGLPSFFLALKPNRERVKGSFLQNVLMQSVPGGLSIVTMILAVYLLVPLFGLNFAEISTLCVLAAGNVGLAVLARTAQPFDRPKAVLLLAMVVLFWAQVLILPGWYVLEPVLSRLAAFYLPMLVLTWPLLMFWRRVFRSRIFHRRPGEK